MDLADAPSPSSRRAASIESAVYWSILGVLLLLYLLPLWLAKYLPMLDLPMHLSLVSAYHHLGDPHWAASRYYESRGTITPYVAFYGLTSLLHHAMPLLTAMKVMLTLIAVALVAALLCALHGLGRSRWLVFLALPLLYDVNATYGYTSYRLSVALALASMGLLRRNLDQPRLWREILLAALALCTYFTHAHGFAVLVLLWGLTVLLCAPRLRLGARALASLLPALAVSAQWYLSALLSQGPSASAAPSSIHAPTLPLIRLLELVPHRLLNSLASGSDELTAIGLGMLWLGLLVVSPRPAVSREGVGLRRVLGAHLPELAAALMLVAYFAVPHQLLTPTQQIFGINYRFLIVIALLGVLVPRAPLRGWAALGVTPAVALSGFFAVVMIGEYRGFDERYRSFDRVLGAIPPGQRVMAFNYEPNDARFTVPVLGHFVGYYCALRAGISSVDQTGATYQYMPVRLRDERAHPTPSFPGPIPLGFFASRYDYFLITDRPGSRRAPFDLRAVRLVAEAGPFRVYAPTAARPRPPAPARR